MMTANEIRQEICNLTEAIAEKNAHIMRCRKLESINKAEAQRDDLIAIRLHYINTLKVMGEWGK